MSWHCEECGNDVTTICNNENCKACQKRDKEIALEDFMTIRGLDILIPYKPLGHALWKALRKLGIKPQNHLLEVQRCPHCGFVESYSYWEDLSITQYLDSQGVTFFSELDNKTE